MAALTPQWSRNFPALHLAIVLPIIEVSFQPLGHSEPQVVIDSDLAAAEHLVNVGPEHEAIRDLVLAFARRGYSAVIR